MSTKNSHSTIQNRQVDLQRLFGEVDEVLAAYLFGSVAEGVSYRHSDLDFAIRLKSELSIEEKHRMRMNLIGALGNLSEREVDVVILNDASLKMTHQVFKHGKPLFVRNDSREEEFRLKKQKEYFDFQYYLEKERRDLRAFYE